MSKSISTPSGSETEFKGALEHRNFHLPLESNRREFLKQSGIGFGLLAVGGMLQTNALSGSLQAASVKALNPLAPKPPHATPKAKSVIFLFMYGGPSQMDTFDYKPQLQKDHGKPLKSLDKSDVFFGGPGSLLRSNYSFRQYGESGAWVSELYPHLSSKVDEIAFIKSCTADSNNHGPALMEMNTGFTRVGSPSMGSWITYGLGTENGDMPGYIVMLDKTGGPINGAQNWSNGFLPGAYQATPFRSTGVPILNLDRAKHHSNESQRRQLNLLNWMNEKHGEHHPAEADLQARIENYELAFRMQMAAPEITDITKESAATQELYGIGEKKTDYFGRQLLLARRMVERGVRFVQVYSGGAHGDNNWDQHGNMAHHRRHTVATDKPITGLLSDLESRGLLEETLIVWGGEFGRLPVAQGGKGRDHNPRGFTMWMAGAGIKGGVSYGATDEYGYRAAENIVTVQDIHATALHQLGVHHEKLTYRFQGRDFRLTDVSGNVIHDILA